MKPRTLIALFIFIFVISASVAIVGCENAQTVPATPTKAPQAPTPDVPQGGVLAATVSDAVELTKNSTMSDLFDAAVLLFPAYAPWLLVGGAVARARKNRRDLLEMATTVEPALDPDAVLAQSSSVKRAVDEAQGKTKFKLPL